jgi:hypothetical protein
MQRKVSAFVRVSDAYGVITVDELDVSEVYTTFSYSSCGAA